jgi:hypothetical protein
MTIESFAQQIVSRRVLNAKAGWRTSRYSFIVKIEGLPPSLLFVNVATAKNASIA